jgi:branched-chain amino acid transport system substrate-binding protein
MRISRVVGCALPAALLVLTGCGGGTATDTGSKAPYVIGAVLTLTGNFSTFGSGGLHGMQIAIDEINKAGGVAGHPLKLETRDSASDPNRGVLAVKDLIDAVHPAFILPDNLSTIVLGTLPVTTEAKIVTMSGASTSLSADPTKFPYQFQMAIPTGPQAVAAMAGIRALMAGKTIKVGILSTNEASGTAISTDEETQVKQAGFEYVGKQLFTSGGADLTVPVSKLKTAGATIVLLHGLGTDVGNTMKAVEGLGWKNVMILGDNSSTSVRLDQVIPAGVTTQFRGVAPRIGARSGDAPSSPFVARLAKEGGIESIPTAAVDHDSVVWWKWAVEKAGSTNSDKVKAALEGVKKVPDAQLPKGLVYGVSNPGFSPTQHGLADADLTHFWAILEPSPLVNGAYKGVVLDLK